MNTKTKHTLLIEFIGWYGILAILLAYILVSFDAIDPTGAIFQLINFTGAAALVIISTVKRVRQLVVLNIIWALVAAAGLVRLII